MFKIEQYRRFDKKKNIKFSVVFEVKIEIFYYILYF